MGRFPLAGELSHDYGDMPIYGRSASAAHTFQLRNRTGKTITIEKIIPGCGCAEVRESARTLEPDQTVDISVTLTLTRAGHKKTTVDLLLGDELGVQTLWIEGTGRKELGVWAAQRQLVLSPGQTTPLVVIAEVMSSDAPPDHPTMNAPDAVEVEFAGWELIEARDTRRPRPARWRGLIRGTMTGDELPGDARLQITLGKAEPVTVHLVESRADSRPPTEKVQTIPTGQATGQDDLP